ncbi:MAG: AbrB/MazE/SpoVT family DNA-binding domain-containing protein [Pseudomonadota bacterium]|jgi:antitoxin component of MazEF toxin-antitoxin module
MLKTITRIGNSHGLIFDAALLDLARLKAGDQVNVEVHEGGAITITPIRPTITPDDAADRARELIQRNAAVFKRLA